MAGHEPLELEIKQGGTIRTFKVKAELAETVWGENPVKVIDDSVRQLVKAAIARTGEATNLVYEANVTEGGDPL